MIDLLSQFFSTVMVMYIVLRAVKLDRVRPWFETRSLYEREQKREAAAHEAARQRSRGGGQSRPPAELFMNPSVKRR